MNQHFPLLLTSLFSLFFLLQCDNMDEIAKKNWEKKHDQMHSADSKDVDRWKQSLAINEAELKALDKSIREMVTRTAQSGAISWRIAQAYMKASNFEMGARYYQRALEETTGSETKNSGTGGRMAFWESALPYFDKSLLYRKVDKELLFELGLAYANASKDMGWEPVRRSRAIDTFIALTRYDGKDSRFPYQLSLIYFDSSISSGTWAIQEGYNDIDKALKLLDEILLVESENVPVRFAKANFLYRLGRTKDSFEEYTRIKYLIEDLDKRGDVKGGLRKNASYQNVLRNLNQIEAGVKN
jgi:tetratricopeptide (TPR) repeat protein